MNSPDQLVQILNVLLIVMTVVLFVLIGIFLMLKVKDSKKSNNAKKQNKNKKEKSKTTEVVYDKQSVLDFMEFDAIEDNMIIRENNKKFVMIIKCTGSNFDLASEEEKLAIESGFIQFLNSLQFPIQIYIQARKFNISESILEYKDKLSKLERKALKDKTDYEIVKRNPNVTEKQRLNAYYNLKQSSNLYEYARDVIANTERLSMNKNIIKKEHYIAISYSPLSEMTSSDKYDDEEMKDKAFSELYTRAQTLIRVLNGCDVTGRILNSAELLELLYVAYNRDQYETYGVDKILNSAYNQLHTTAPDVLDKKIKLLDEKAEEMAARQANDLIHRVRSKKEKKVETREKNFDDIVSELTKMILEKNKESIGKEDLQEAMKLLEENVEKTKEGKNKNEIKKGTRRTRKATDIG